MAPFIRIPKKVQTGAGTKTELHFVNAEEILKAVFEDNPAVLSITLRSSPKTVEYILKGEEAIQALAVLQALP